MENQPMFDTSKIVRATGRKPRCLWRLVSWWRRITGRDRYHVGIDYAEDGGPDYWCKAVYDTKTGIYTVLETGRGEPPANTKVTDALPEPSSLGGSKPVGAHPRSV